MATDTLSTAYQASVERTKLIRAGLHPPPSQREHLQGPRPRRHHPGARLRRPAVRRHRPQGCPSFHAVQPASVGHLRSGHPQDRAGAGPRRRPVRRRFPRRQPQMAARSGHAELEQGDRGQPPRRCARRLRDRRQGTPVHRRNRRPPRRARDVRRRPVPARQDRRGRRAGLGQCGQLDPWQYRSLTWRRPAATFGSGPRPDRRAGRQRQHQPTALPGRSSPMSTAAQRPLPPACSAPSSARSG